jgi:membrane protease YdiL (CAAX protease family)
MKQGYPTVKQANLMFLLIAVAILTGSALLAPRLGIGTNLWINEYVWILAPSVILVKLGKMPAKEVLKLRRISGRNILPGTFAAVGMWFFAFYLSKITGIFLDARFGSLATGTAETVSSSNQTLLVLIGVLVLAPVCEELLFRGVIQSAYEAHNRKYGFVMSAVLFGMFHVLNGVTEVLPTFLAGLLLGYLVYRTGSIAASMLAHMAFNVSSVFINGALGLSSLKTIPLWLHPVCIGAFVLVLVLLSRVRPAGEKEETAGAPAAGSCPAGGIVTFILSGVFVLAIGAAEIYVRQIM